MVGGQLGTPEALTRARHGSSSWFEMAVPRSETEMSQFSVNRRDPVSQAAERAQGITGFADTLSHKPPSVATETVETFPDQTPKQKGGPLLESAGLLLTTTPD